MRRLLITACCLAVCGCSFSCSSSPRVVLYCAQDREFAEDLSLVEIHHIIPKHVGGNDDWSNLCLVLRWAHIALHASHGRDYSKASLKDVPFSGL